MIKLNQSVKKSDEPPRMKTFRDLRPNSEKRFAHLFDNSAEKPIVTDPKRRILTSTKVPKQRPTEVWLG